MEPASGLVKIKFGDYLKTLRRCGGYYICPKDDNGKRLGPLVGYAGKYKDNDGTEKQWVGDVYYNFAKAEEYPHVLDYFSKTLASEITRSVGRIDYVVGAPMGGIAIAKDVSRHLDCRFIFAEKKVVALATKESREKSVLILNRHEIEPGSRVAIIEDVCNNFSTTEQLAGIIISAGDELECIACELNRSSEIKWGRYPVVSMLYIPTLQYRQSDKEVAEDVANGNIVLNPKDEWSRLIAAMEAAKH